MPLKCITVALLKSSPELHPYTDYGTIPRICHYRDLSDLKSINYYY